MAIEVSGGQGPYRVSIVDGQGRTVSQAKLKKAGKFGLNIRSDIDAITAILEDDEGLRVEVEATQSDPKVRLLLRD